MKNQLFSHLFSKSLKARHKISWRMYAGIGTAMVLILLASASSLFSFNTIANTQREVVDQSFPQITGAFEVAEQSGALVAAAPRLASASTPAELEEVRKSIQENQEAFVHRIGALEQDAGADPAEVKRVQEQADALIANIEQLDRSVEQRFVLANRIQELRLEITLLSERLKRILGPIIDNQYFYAITGYQGLDSERVPQADHLSAEELKRYRHLSKLEVNGDTAGQLLLSAFTMGDAQLLEPLVERHETASSAIGRSLAALPELPSRYELVEITDRLQVLGSGPESGFALRRRELDLAAEERQLLADNSRLGVALVAAADIVVNSARNAAEISRNTATATMEFGRTLLLGVTLIAIASGILAGWLFVGNLLRRLGDLVQQMRRMAAGDLQTKVEVHGRDEVADMAAALEVFRDASLKAQRVDLVEQMAMEVQNKNDELEKVLQELHKAQDQIIMREKLAELGELTAGVAHEIRNPLNFVKNFSEASGELVEELQETLEEETDKFDEDQRSLIEEILGDLESNLERIGHHGGRADRIVRDMLKMGSGSGESQATDLNLLLDEHMRLAYHSARATNKDFNVTIEQELADDLKPMNLVTQDMGRVFLNMVANSCYAIFERQSREKEAGRGEAYVPLLRLKTIRAGDWITVSIFDNGGGIPDEALAKIFNPFFTTKPTDQGTGLGLALSNDIVRQHGGEIMVNVEKGETTEMVVQLPVSLEVGQA